METDTQAAWTEPGPRTGARPMTGTRVSTPRARAELLERVEGHIEEVRHNLIVEIKKLTQLREQVDEARLAIRELTGGAR